jgi:hypothetical protein
MKTAPAAMASTHTAQPTAHRTTPERDRAAAGWRCAGPVSGVLAATRARLAPSVSSPADGSCPPSSLVSTARATGRLAGSGARQAATTSRSSSGSAARSCGPTGGRPIAAKITVFAQASRSAAGVAAPYGGVMPKWVSRGPSGLSTTWSGLSAPWTSPVWWIAMSPVAVPTASASRLAGGRGPSRRTTSVRVGPGTYSVTR